jgi:hypothetical protein
MRDMAETGLSPENCELWFERAVLVSLAIFVVVFVVRVIVLPGFSEIILLTRYDPQLHFLLAVSNYYSHLTRHQRAASLPQHTQARSADSFPLQRVYLLPPPKSSDPNAKPGAEGPNDQEFVYAPLPLSSLSPEAARDLRATATTAWISHSAPDHKSHLHSHRHRHHSSSSSSGKISLPISPGEGLLPAYGAEESKSSL